MLAPPLWMTICAGCYIIKKKKDKKRPPPRRPPVRTPRPGVFTTPEIPDSSVPPGDPGTVPPGSVGTPLVHPGSLSIGPQANRRPKGRRRGRIRRN